MQHGVKVLLLAPETVTWLVAHQPLLLRALLLACLLVAQPLLAVLGKLPSVQQQAQQRDLLLLPLQLPAYGASGLTCRQMGQGPRLPKLLLLGLAETGSRQAVGGAHQAVCALALPYGYRCLLRPPWTRGVTQTRFGGRG